ASTVRLATFAEGAGLACACADAAEARERPGCARVARLVRRAAARAGRAAEIRRACTAARPAVAGVCREVHAPVRRLTARLAARARRASVARANAQRARRDAGFALGARDPAARAAPRYRVALARRIADAAALAARAAAMVLGPAAAVADQRAVGGDVT